jgi:hypothetical protein
MTKKVSKVKSKTRAEANRRNAARSTGPRTAKGRLRSAQNARRHGFASVVVGGTKLSDEAEKLACAIAGPDPSPQRLHQARIIAETQFTLAKIAISKITTIKFVLAYKVKSTNVLLEPEQRCAIAVVKSLDQLRRLDRYERRASARFSRTLRLLNV